MSAEGDESERAEPPGRPVVEDNSLGRLLALSDGVFAIAMTLIALDLRVPDLGDHPADSAFRHALSQNSGSYWSYLITFYVVANYWIRHRRLMKSVVSDHPVLIRDTLLLLLFVAAMPFPSSLLGKYGGEPISILLYGAINAAATLTLILMSWDIHRLGLSAGEFDPDSYYAHSLGTWKSLVVFLMCLPAGYVIGSWGPIVLVLLAVPDGLVRLAWPGRRRHG